MSDEPAKATPRKEKVNLKYVSLCSTLLDCKANPFNSDASGAEKKVELDTSTAILKKKKKPNSLM
jgi:hypothetical protein